MNDLLTELERQARSRYVRWDPALWRALVGGPAQALSERLLSTGGALGAARTVIEMYLKLAAEGVGLGYLYPSSAGVENVFSLFWNTLLPEQLPRLAPGARAQALAQAWNLAENLESSPLWLRRIFHRALRGLPGLDALPAAVTRIEQLAAEVPAERLDTVRRLEWIHLGSEDRRFLPGAVHFLAPRVLCVHDRERTAAGGRDAVTFGVWLDDAPQLLGPMGCKLAVEPSAQAEPLLEAAARLDARFTAVHHATFAPHAAVASLSTSQFVVVLRP